MSTIPIAAPAQSGYQQYSQAAVLSILSDRLNDPANIYWSLAELRLYIAEALRTWQAYTGWFRNRVSIPVVAGQIWYDLSSLAPAFTYNVTDQYLAQQILYLLLESQLVNGAWTGTAQFDLAKLQSAIQTRRDRFLSDTGTVVSYVRQKTGLSPAIGRASIAANIIDVRRLAWVTASGTVSVLWKASEWDLNAFAQGWVQAPTDPPSVYSSSVTSPTQLQLAPPPLNPGLLEMVVVRSGPALSLPTATTALGVPDDFAWGIKFGAIADLLTADGQAKDLSRAAYCEQRYQECVQIAKQAPSALQAQVQGVPVWLGSVFDLDAFASGWENSSPGAPSYIGFAGRNLFALSPPPATAMTITFDIVTNMPVPVLDTDIIQIPPDVVPVLLDYVQHLASFKMGGDDAMGGVQQYRNLLIEAAAYNNRLRQLDFFNDAVRSPALTNQAETPRIETPVLVSYRVPGNG